MAALPSSASGIVLVQLLYNTKLQRWLRFSKPPYLKVTEASYTPPSRASDIVQYNLLNTQPQRWLRLSKPPSTKKSPPEWVEIA